MSNTNTGGPAFPMGHTEAAMYASCMEDLANPSLDDAERAHLSAKATALCGMTLRDYFAAKAMQGLLADQTIKAEPEEFAYEAYNMADAMLKARQS
jgi:hypothetical protein